MAESPDRSRLGELVWADGRVIAASDFRLDPRDEGLLYARGLFETTRTFDCRPWLWTEHLGRLIRSAEELGIAVDAARLPDADEAARFVRMDGAGDVVLRLNVSAGPAGGAGRVWLFARPLPEPKESAALATSPYRVDPVDPFARHKCFNYALRLAAHREAAARGADDALLLDPAGNLLEAAHANLFVRIGEEWRTPPPGGGVLPGIVRRLVLDRLLDAAVEAPTHRSELDAAGEAFLTNSVVGIVPVARIDQRPLDVGERTRELRERLRHWMQ